MVPVFAPPRLAPTATLPAFARMAYKSQMALPDVTQTHQGSALIGHWRACNFMIGSALFFSNTCTEW